MRNLRFLVVDDSKIILNAVRNIITNRMGSDQILLAKNGLDAMGLLETHKVDIIICDWHMPIMDGLQLLIKVRCINELKNTPFIMMSTQGSKEDVATSIQKGANQFMVKPFSPEKLDDTVRKAWNSVTEREARRYSGLPKHTVKALFNGVEHEADVVDISRDGTLLKLPYTDNIKLFGTCEIILDFEEIDQLALINLGPIGGRVLRISSAEGYHHSIKKCDVALHFIPELLTRDVAGQIKTLLIFLRNKEKALLNAAMG